MDNNYSRNKNKSSKIIVFLRYCHSEISLLWNITFTFDQKILLASRRFSFFKNKAWAREEESVWKCPMKVWVCEEAQAGAGAVGEGEGEAQAQAQV